ncbi:MAG: hypothetical protein FWE88_01640 [Phycisphaerae bacterium]|nr:hypothetical protein [Phycisphaerae bacterium]
MADPLKRLADQRAKDSRAVDDPLQELAEDRASYLKEVKAEARREAASQEATWPAPSRRSAKAKHHGTGSLQPCFAESMCTVLIVIVIVAGIIGCVLAASLSLIARDSTGLILVILGIAVTVLLEVFFLVALQSILRYLRIIASKP